MFQLRTDSFVRHTCQEHILILSCRILLRINTEKNEESQIKDCMKKDYSYTPHFNAFESKCIDIPTFFGIALNMIFNLVNSSTTSFTLYIRQQFPKKNIHLEYEIDILND